MCRFLIKWNTKWQIRWFILDSSTWKSVAPQGYCTYLSQINRSVIIWPKIRIPDYFPWKVPDRPVSIAKTILQRSKKLKMFRYLVKYLFVPTIKQMFARFLTKIIILYVPDIKLWFQCFSRKGGFVATSAADLKLFIFYPDQDPTCQIITDPDPTF